MKNLGVEDRSLGTKLRFYNSSTEGRREDSICMKSTLKEDLAKMGGSKGWRAARIKVIGLGSFFFNFYEV